MVHKISFFRGLGYNWTSTWAEWVDDTGLEDWADEVGRDKLDGVLGQAKQTGEVGLDE